MSDETMPSRLIDGLVQHLMSLGQSVKLRETHISWVLLTDELAYKLRKPVHLAFLDFTTLEARRRDCEQELRLNRRWAPGLYLCVVPISGSDANPELRGSGPIIDYAVCMRRFPEDAVLRERLLAGHVHAAEIRRLAETIAEVHHKAPAASASSVWAASGRAVNDILKVISNIEQHIGSDRQPEMKRIREWVRDQAGTLAPLMASRARKGLVRECHGDLHLGNVAWIDDAWTPFDGIEFDEQLRWIDVINDLAFLTMDLKVHGRQDLAFTCLDEYLQQTGDYEGVQLLRLYEVYRALVRTLVLSLSPAGGRATSGAPRVEDYLRFAIQAAAALRKRPCMVLMHGLSGSGKSTLAGVLAASLPAIRVRSDVERKRLFGLEPLASSKARREDIYSDEATAATTQRLLSCAAWSLGAGWSFIADATFLRHAQRQRFLEMSNEYGAACMIVHCDAEEACLRDRLSARGVSGSDPSEATIPVLAKQIQHTEPLTHEEMSRTCVVPTNEPVPPSVLTWLSRTIARRASFELH